MIPVKPFNDEVLYAADPIVRVARQDIEETLKLAGGTPRRRMRICAHRGVEDRLHEMLIIHARDAYVRPHKHPGKSESFHLIEGAVDIVLFDDPGKITSVIEMGDYASGKAFYYRIADPIYHTLLIRSDMIVFHEATNGPFNRTDTVFAPWAPEESDRADCERFMTRVAAEATDFLRGGRA